MNHIINEVLDEAEVYRRRVAESLQSSFPLRIIDVFAGCGGLTLGFTSEFGHHFEPVWANDLNPWAAETYNNNLGSHCTVGDIVEILADPETQIPEAEVVVGGPPCQGFSLLNRNRAKDSRKHLWRPFLEVVERANAPIFVMENVPQLLASREYEEITQAAEQLGFRLTAEVLTAADFGVPQIRKRAFIVGCNFADPSAIFPPRRTHVDPRRTQPLRLQLSDTAEDVLAVELQPWRTVRDAIEDLPPPVGTDIRRDMPDVESHLDLHFGRRVTELSLKRYRTIPDEGMNRFDLQRRAPDLTPRCWIDKTSGGGDLFGRLWWNRPAFTIRTEFWKPEKGRYLHPSEDRAITHREAARFQSFPDSFRFVGSKTEIARQIGNAVPPLLASRVADSIYALLTHRQDEGQEACRRDLAESAAAP